jgi:uncharacterized protein (TIGR02680 family)
MARDPHRFRLARAGVLNVWQYDEQVFEFADGRLLLRGTNGAGKSKTLEMLLPFVLDGDKARMTATGRSGSQLLWLMTDGATSAGTRTGYLWVELVRTDPEGGVPHVVTCGIGIRHSASARSVTTWQFTVPTTVPDLVEPDGTPLSAPRCRERVSELGGQSFDAPRAYKEHVGRLLFGLEPHAYDDLLRLLYWLRQPQVGEDLDPSRLVGMLDESLPALDADAVRQVGEALDELAEHGERVERLAAAAEAVAGSASLYARYAAGVVHERAADARAAERERAARRRALGSQVTALAKVEDELAGAQAAQTAATEALTTARDRVQVLESGPLARNQAVLREKRRRAAELHTAAERAAGGAGRAEERAKDSRARVERGTGELADAGQRLAASVAAAQAALHASAVVPGLPVATEPVAQAGALEDGVPAARRRVTAARAAVGVVREALGDVERRTQRKDAAAQRAAEAERDEELAEGRLGDAVRETAALSEQWRQHAGAWAAEQPDLELVVGLPTPELLVALPARAREAVTPVLAGLHDRQAGAAAQRAAAQDQLERLLRRRSEILAERDPAPPAPVLDRPDRDQGRGLPLWRLVDVRDGGADAGRAARVEAALQASGLLDAQVLADGSWQSADDTVLSAAPLDGPTLRAVLRPDVPDDSPVVAEVVEHVLTSVALLDSVTGVEGPPAVGHDGSWRLGPLTGRASKPVAQYVGSAAREGERRRRLAEVEASQAATLVDRDAAARVEAEAAAGTEALRGWLDRLPSATELRTAEVRVAEREAARDRARAAATSRADQLTVASAELARGLEVLRRLCGEHDLPDDRAGLQARADALGTVEVLLAALAAEAVRLLTAARRLEEDVEGAERDAQDAERAQEEARASVQAAREAAQESQALLDTLGADVQRMQAELDQAQGASRTAARDREEAVTRVLVLTERRGQERAGVTEAERRLAEAVPLVTSTVAAVAALPAVPGLLPAALARDLSEQERDGLAALADEPLPRAALQLLGAWSELAVDAPADANAVYRDLSHLAAGPAADHEPRVVDVGEDLAVLARDAAGAEQPLGVVAVRLAAEVARERELLTDRERTLFEEHLLGELGDALRSRSAEAADLVRGMNDLLADVRTSQGIRVRLDWALRDDVGADVRAAVELLGRPRGSLSPDEAAQLRYALSSLIEVQRAAEPEQGYAEHLARALDYRRWSAFAVRLHRPGTTSWTMLTRRTPLSQGEQKVVCYLPLFAAAAAHFTSVAGAAPYAPRLVLLDDAFPKIDVRTHPLLFGLLVDLDLDFVLTSERLWGDHPTVPSLAVYEALRAPGERGIAQYRYTWDGSTLVGQG